MLKMLEGKCSDLETRKPRYIESFCINIGNFNVLMVDKIIV